MSTESKKTHKDKKVQIKPFKLKGFPASQDVAHKTIIESELKGDHVIPPTYVKVSGGKNGPYHVPQYASTVYGVSTKYDPEHNCKG